jgi:membrane dipeptidase
MMRGLDIGIDGDRSQVDLPKLKAGGVDASFFALYTSADLSEDEAATKVLEMIARVYDALDAYSEQAALALTPEDALRNKGKGLISIFLGIENGSPIHKSLPLLRQFYRMGVRYMTLTHNGDNEIADSAAQGTRWHGLSPFGREVVDEMNRLGMIVDVAHVSDETFYDVIKCSKAPIVSTHSCCRALASHRRNMTDDMIRTLADHGGVIQINFYPVFLSDLYASFYEVKGEKASPRPGVSDVVNHIYHAVKVGGIEHVGIGTDFDGIEVTPKGLEDISKLPKVFDQLKRKGYSEDQIELIAGKNFLRTFNDVISSSLRV